MLVIYILTFIIDVIFVLFILFCDKISYTALTGLWKFEP